ncbi:benzene 1,2-dioxygenase [Novacetimonas cocois]|uniref:Benzene 1,2-dioxygenase n=2 Tax=Novacetimonas cocois TaxID=1747507 RepID=A0A365YUF7_9PROT|nr:benzene 1,2-dioxygenase [Novacetimonas cocois]
MQNHDPDRRNSMHDISDTENTWFDVIAVSEVRGMRPVRVEVAGTAMVLVSQEGEVRAFAATCPHKGAPLEKGIVCEGRIVCPWHKAEFSAHDGRLLEPLALDPLPRYPTRVRQGRVEVAPHVEPSPSSPRVAETRSVIIVGAGAAGTATAVFLREAGFAGRITLIGQEDCAPYDRTALSKNVLAGKAEHNAPPPLRPENFYETHDVVCRVGRVVAMEPETRTLRLADGESLSADHVVLAPGSTPRMLDVPGHDLKGVFTLRTSRDAQAILSSGRARRDWRVVICGGSFIAMEAAAALRQHGANVTIVADPAIPFENVLGVEIGGRLRALYEANGVVYRGGRRVAKIVGDDHVGGVILDNGESLAADTVVAGIGVRPATDFLPQSLLAGDGGIDVDGRMRVLPGIHVVGDAARFMHGGRRMRIEHWRTAQVQGRVAARAIVGMEDEFDEIPWFWTQQFGKKLEYAGYQEEFDHVEIEGDLEHFDFTATLSRQGRPVGVITGGRPDVTARMVVRPLPG